MPMFVSSSSSSTAVSASAALLLVFSCLCSYLVYQGDVADVAVYRLLDVPHRTFIFIKSRANDKYLRVSSPTIGSDAAGTKNDNDDEDATDTTAVFDLATPWYFGSRLEVHRCEPNADSSPPAPAAATGPISADALCFRLQSSTQKWLSYRRNDNNDRHDDHHHLTLTLQDSETEASKFAAVNIQSPSSSSFSSSPSPSSQQVSSTSNSVVMIKICNEDVWLTAQELQLMSTAAASGENESKTVLAALDKSHSKQGSSFWSKLLFHMSRSSAADSYFVGNQEELREQRTSATILSSSLTSLSLFELEVSPRLHGVNLGGWFIPEVWMQQSFFAGSGLLWGNSLCTLSHLNKSLAEDRIAHNLATWITEEDFREIAAYGYNSFRLPIGYWNIIEDPLGKYSPSKLSTSLHYIDFAFDMAKKYGLKVIVDLHGLPGSQNGMDHSGCSEPPSWLNLNDDKDKSKDKDSKTEIGGGVGVGVDHLELSVAAIEAIARRYGGGRSQLAGIELANEPGNDYSRHNHSTLLAYYQRAYEVVRRFDKSILVLFNELYDDLVASWSNELREPEYYNVVLDLHLYDWQLPYTMRSKQEHIEDARKWKAWIAQHSQHHPIIVGEWCMSTGTFVQAGQPFVDAAVGSFRAARGWFLWNWKIEEGLGFDEWSVQHQLRKKRGLRTGV